MFLCPLHVASRSLETSHGLLGAFSTAVWATKSCAKEQNDRKIAKEENDGGNMTEGLRQNGSEEKTKQGGAPVMMMRLLLERDPQVVKRKKTSRTRHRRLTLRSFHAMATKDSQGDRGRSTHLQGKRIRSKRKCRVHLLVQAELTQHIVSSSFAATLSSSPMRFLFDVAQWCCDVATSRFQLINKMMDPGGMMRKHGNWWCAQCGKL